MSHATWLTMKDVWAILKRYELTPVLEEGEGAKSNFQPKNYVWVDHAWRKRALR